MELVEAFCLFFTPGQIVIGAGLCLERGSEGEIPCYALMVQGSEEVDGVTKLAQQGFIVLGKIVFVDIMVGSGARDRDVRSLKSFPLSLWLTPVGRLA
jgi:hypothetical protein